MTALDFIRSDALGLPSLAKFAIALAVILSVPRLSRRIRLPTVVVLLLSGVVLGPHGVDLIGEHRPVADFFADLGKLLLMFFAGLEIDLTRFKQARQRTLVFGLLTTALPLFLGTAVGLLLGYGTLGAIVLGSLLASHTLLGGPIVARLALVRQEPITVTYGATVMSDTLSLLVFAVCLASFKSGFSLSILVIQTVEIAIFVPLILFGLSRAGTYVLAKQDHEDEYFIAMLLIVAITGMLAQSINLPGIVGAFLAGLAINVAAHAKPAKEKLEFIGNSFFIPIFFIVTGFLIDPPAFLSSILDNGGLVVSIVGALFIGKWLAAEFAGRMFGYSAAARHTIWSLTLPQVAATLAATLVAYDTLDPAGHRLVDERLLNAVLVLMLTTAIAGPVLTARFAPLMLKDGITPDQSARIAEQASAAPGTARDPAPAANTSPTNG
ncbi:cation:proton antiporter [Bradyrhizobium sp. CB2312]|uniref:cation:proton antiporter n=1 Tax=Bradyrhizobium sp. CB2312 TaxID=3039155 RepID=UPI0024B04AA7|nr:cation:proton antiporter [Bradyrhizobium sp. CB2312]WFU75541.1 cation:proton antiporter [Bradyrhizobium sp. CB2312]